MKTWLRKGIELLGIVFLLPQMFVLCYYFGYFFKGGNPLGLVKATTLYALSISWVSAPFLVLATVLVKVLIGSNVRWFVTFPVCWVAGYVWVAAWNLLVFETFSYGRAALPIVLCSVVSAGYGLARRVYEASLPPPSRSRESRHDADHPESVERQKSDGGEGD